MKSINRNNELSSVGKGNAPYMEEADLPKPNGLAKPKLVSLLKEPIETEKNIEGMKTLTKPKIFTKTESKPSFTTQPAKEPLIKRVESTNSYISVPNNQVEDGYSQNETSIDNTDEKNNKKENDKPLNLDEALLTVTEFYCQYFELINEVIDNVLTHKYGSKIAEAIENIDIRKQVEVDSFDEIRDYIVMKKLNNLNFSLIPDYIKIIYAQAMGYGILENLINDKEIDEIMVSTYHDIYVEKNGIPELTEYKFPNYEVALGIARRIIRPLNKTLDVSNPNVDGQLQNGSRISASIPPLRAEGEISITIRKFSQHVEPLINYANKYKSSTPEMVKFIESEFYGKKTTVVSGGTGSGKTTLLNSMSFALNPKERILVIEDTREIKIQQPHVEYYLKVPKTSEGFKGIEIEDIIQMALRKRPDRIIVGECRGPEMNEFLNAANTGHEGSATSVHANNPESSFARMENMLLKNEETKNMTHEAIMRVLTASIDIIIQTNRLEDGTRKITNITEVLGYGEEGFNKLKKMKLTKPDEVPDLNKVYMRDIFYFKRTETEEIIKEDGTKKLVIHGQFIANGYVPFCNRELKRKGVGFDNQFFEKRVLMEV